MPAPIARLACFARIFSSDSLTKPMYVQVQVPPFGRNLRGGERAEECGGSERSSLEGVGDGWGTPPGTSFKPSKGELETVLRNLDFWTVG